MRSFKRRKRAGLWLPPDPYDTVVAGLDVITSPTQNIIKTAFLNLPNAQGFGGNDSIPLVGDFNEYGIAGVGSNPLSPGVSLADLTQGYSLQRVVGKLFLGIAERTFVTEGAASTWFFTAGIIVRRVDDNGDPVQQDGFADSYDAARDPWLWRRQWILKNPAATPAGAIKNIPWPQHNAQYGGGTWDGPHVDQKTRRTVKSEERLFLDISAVALDGSDEQTTSAAYCWFDFRFFGRTFTSAGNRRNATR